MHEIIYVFEYLTLKIRQLPSDYSEYTNTLLLRANDTMRKVASSLPVTAKDIAQEVGLSQPTVSRILAGSDGFHVTSATRDRVLRTASRMGYRPNEIARSLRQRRTNVVGFYTPHHYLDAHSYFLASLIGGLQHAADPYGFDIMLHRGNASSSIEDVCRKLMGRRIDGLIVHSNESSPLVALLRDAALPVIAVTDAISGIPSVVCDDADGIRLLIEYLWAKGHRRIAFLRPSNRFYSVETRCEAFVSEMCSRGALPEDFPILSIDMETSAAALPTLLSLPSRPTAVCCWNDMTAYNLLHACRLAGISVPDTLAVVGFDGFHDPNLMAWSLVTVSASWNAVAAQAMQSLMQLINDHQISTTAGKNVSPRQEVPLISQIPVTFVAGTTA